MADKLMYIPNDDTQNYSLRRLQLMVEMFKHILNESTNQNSVKAAKLVSQRIGKRYCKTLGTSVINSPMSPPSLCLIVHNLTRDQNKHHKNEIF